MEDRRQFERIPARFQVRFQKPEQAAKAFSAWSVNVSAGGLALKVGSEYQLGERLVLTLTVEERSFPVEGIVAWRRGEVIGVRFESLDDDMRTELETLVESFRRKAKGH